jgi:predicted nucleic acid-binding protein
MHDNGSASPIGNMARSSYKQSRATAPARAVAATPRRVWNRDALLAATAFEHDLDLATRNTRDMRLTGARIRSLA